MDIMASIQRIKGCYLCRIQRICDMIGLYFSDICLDEGHDLKDEIYGLHIQCWVRMIENNRVTACSEEMYVPVDTNCDSFQYDVDESVFDVSRRNFVNSHRNILIEQVCVERNGDLKLIFSDESIIQIIVNKTDNEDELWRFMMLTEENQPHIIRTNAECILSETD